MSFSLPQPIANDRTRFTQRGAALLLTLLVHLALILLVLWQRSVVEPARQERTPTTFTLVPGAKKDEADDKQPAKADHQRQERNAQSAASPGPLPVPVPRPTKPRPPDTDRQPFLILSNKEFAASNIAAVPTLAKGDDAGQGRDSAAIAGPGQGQGKGQGPGGAQLYQAEWYRRPTGAELDSYLPASPPEEGWGLVACRTVEEYHVENCQTLGESPLGSGFAKAVRQAAWQFLVRPPRINGKPMIGEWVRIRIDYVHKSVTVR